MPPVIVRQGNLTPGTPAVFALQDRNEAKHKGIPEEEVIKGKTA
jgi:hypothetical protein